MFKNIFICTEEKIKECPWQQIDERYASTLLGKECLVISDKIIDVSVPVIGLGLEYKGHADFIVENICAVSKSYLDMVYARVHHEPLTIANTKRLIIREASMADSYECEKLYQSVKDCKCVEIPKVPMEEYICGCINWEYPIYGYGLWQIIYKDNNKIIGRCGIENNKDGMPEAGYFLMPDYRGMGIAQEAMESVLQYCHEELCIEKIVAKIEKENVSSLRLIEKLGFQKLQEQDNVLIFINQMHNE